jgi:hypothetical protein
MQRRPGLHGRTSWQHPVQIFSLVFPLSLKAVRRRNPVHESFSTATDNICKILLVFRENQQENFFMAGRKSGVCWQIKFHANVCTAGIALRTTRQNPAP